MRLNILKSVRDSLPEFVKPIFQKSIRNRLINNKYFVSTFNELFENEKKDDEVILKDQIILLKKQLIYSNNYVPYYSQLFKAVNFIPEKFSEFYHLEKIPFLTKEIICKNFNDLISREPVKHYTATTGGSTGAPLKFLLDYNSVFKENAYIYYFRSKFGYGFNSKVVTFRGVEYGKRYWKYNPFHNELLLSPFSLSEKTISFYLKMIYKYKPAFLNGYLSSIYFFVELLQQNNIKFEIPIKCIFLISESNDEQQRAIVEKYFNCPSMSFYGHSERACIAQECTQNIYKFNPYYGYTEYLKNGSETREIVCTGFLSKVMPFIRYKTGDLCKYEKDGYKIVGRWHGNDLIYGFNNEQFSHAAFNFHSDIMENVLSYQIIQQEKGKAILHIVPNKKFTIRDENKIYHAINKKVGNSLNVTIHKSEKAILTPRGKFKVIINEIS